MGLIPEGLYCYGKNGKCLFWILKEINGVKFPYCNHLLRGDITHISDSDFEKLKKHYGCHNDEDLYKIFKGELLWDQVKECGINEFDE